MNRSESIVNISKALLEAQKQIMWAKKDAQNPYFKSKYADLPAVIEACKDHLNNNGIIALQPIQDDYVETVLIHTSGEWMASITRIVCKAPNDPQAYGSAVTYARRYGLQSFVLMPADNDDAETAMMRKQGKSEDEIAEKKAGLTLDRDDNGETLSEKASNHIKVLATIMHQKDTS